MLLEPKDIAATRKKEESASHRLKCRQEQHSDSRSFILFCYGLVSLPIGISNTDN